ncbi:MAG TPA: HEAT repeat domain-containing protein [Roseiflexaceae bacterium]|nr:HEAT repeat domain-containing protein [Roseiflexaceae bacterium]
MVALNVTGRFRHQNDLHSYRRRLANEVTQDFAIRLLPALADVPLEIVDLAGSPRSLTNALRDSQQITLAGSSGSGRRLALQQWAYQWALGNLPGTPAPILLALARLDDGLSPPDRLLSAFIRAATPPTDPKTQRDLLPFLRRGASASATEAPAHSLLLAHGWEDLPPERRALWRAALLDLMHIHPSIAIVLTQPTWEPAWPAFTPLVLAPPSPALLAGWVEHLAPVEQRAPLLEIVAQPGAPLGERLFEVALLAWLAPRVPLPRTRGGLYAEALAQALGLPIAELDHAPLVRELQLLAAYGERPTDISTSLIELGGGGIPHFVHPQAGRYLAARQLISEQRYDLLCELGEPEQSEIARLIATTLSDPTPLYKALWRAGKPRAEQVLTLGQCLRERAPAEPAWALRVVGALARLAADAAPTTRARAEEQLLGCLPALDASLNALAGAEAGYERFLIRLFQALSADIAVPRMLRLAYHPQLGELFAWQLADLAVERGLAHVRSPAPTGSRDALARWLYVEARASAADQRQIDPAAAEAGLEALADSRAGETRKLQAATALLEDPEQASTTRRAALALLANSAHPAALTAIERASSDADPTMRGAALEALNRRSPERASIALGRAASDGSASLELRLETIERMGAQPGFGTSRVLDQCAGDPSLPLYARLQAIAALGRQADGGSALLRIAGDASQHDAIRSAAARQLGASKYTESLDLLIRLSDNPQTPAALAEACCDGIGALRARAGGGVLLRILRRTPADLTLILAALRALGQIGAAEMSEPISHLLGAEALQLLQHDIAAAQLEQPTDVVVGDQALPKPIALRLAAALAMNTTAAERPTTLAEFLSSEADLLRAAAARALATIGGNTARAALLAALLDDSTGGATAEVIAALADLEGQSSAEALGYLLAAPEVNLLTRWLVVRRLTDHPAGEEVMRRALAQPATDTFTRGALAEGLGQRGSFAALPALRQIAEDREQDQQLRAQALLALGLLNEQASETALIRMIADPQENATLRGLAAEHLPEQLSSEGRRFLRDLLRNERPPAAIVIGSLRALGHVRDREALPLMLRYGQDENAEIAQAAITALTDLGDGSVAPLLVRITHHIGADHTLRLQAAGALLRIGGDGYRPLLRVYLEQGPLPLRLLALEHLIASDTAADDLLAMLASPDWPATLRLRLIDYFAGDLAAAPVLAAILEDTSDQIQLRALAAEALGQMRSTSTLTSLVRLAESEDSPAALRLRCIDALGRIGGTSALTALSHLAEEAGRSPEVRTAALQALRRAGEQHST